MTSSSLVLVPLLAMAVVGMQMVREQRYPRADEPLEVLYVTSPQALRRAALSFDAIVSDLYWIRAIQYYGGTRLSARAEKSYDLLYPLLDLTTSLDPQFAVAYKFGAFFLSEEPPGGPGRPELAIRLLEKAIAENPDEWEYPYHLAFVHYRRREFQQAAEWFERAADERDAPEWVRPLVAVMLTEGGNTNSARLVWRSLLDSEVEFTRRDAARRLQQLDAIDFIEQLRQAVAAYADRAGRPPATWQEMIRARVLPGVPVDPVGTPYILDPQTSEVTLSPESSLWPLTLEDPS